MKMNVSNNWNIDFFNNFFRARLDSSSGHETLTKSAPTSSRDLICLTVALTSVVSVLVIDWTDIGESPPTSILPTLIFLVFFLNISPGSYAHLIISFLFKFIIMTDSL